MKIEIKEKPTKSFYDELLYIQTNYKKIINKPNKRVRKLTTSILCYSLIALLSTLFSLHCYKQFRYGNEFKYIAFFFSVLYIFSLFYFIIVKRRLKQIIDYSKKTKSSLEIDHHNISLVKKESTVSITWDSLKNIVINKYSVLFLPKDIASTYIAINTEYKEEILKIVKKYKYTNLIQDNSELYK